MESQNVLTKMSVKTLKCTPALAGIEKRQVPMARIIGTARGIKEAVGNDGSAVFGMTGNFHGVNIATGFEAVSGVLYLPGGIAEMVLEPLDAALDKDKTSSISFAFDIFAEPSDNKAGYSYSAQNLMAATQIDPFAEIKSAISSFEVPKLQAPKK